MLSWASRGSFGLLCNVRPPVRSVRFSPGLVAGRTFATTPVLQRGKPKKKSKSKIEKEKAKEREYALNNPNALEDLTKTMRKRTTPQDFTVVVDTVLQEIKANINPEDPILLGWTRFERSVTTACKMDDKVANTGKLSPLKQLRRTLHKAYLDKKISGLRSKLEEILHSEDLTARYSLPHLEHQREIADLRFPAEWYGQARSMQRTIHLHVGPTNSGKTYHALKRLEQSKNGFYAGPLRLLAQEVYQRFKAKGVPCSLITGDDVQIPEGDTSTIVSNTVEMADLGQIFEVGVIDEIQMIADPSRGWAWTRAVLGCRAEELHLCGEARAVPLIREFAALTGDNLKIHHYERLNPLRVMDQSLGGDLKKLQKGDCLVAFSRVGIHALKADIERVTGRRAAIVYGGLPSEIRTQQANLFNDPDNDYDYLVASDAIGMGLNLSCKRIIFETLVKKLPTGFKRLTLSEIKQIGGRAGRYRSAAQTGNKGNSEEENIGYVTSMEDVDLPYIRAALGQEPAPITAAGLFPPEPVFHKFAAYFPGNVPFKFVLARLLEISQVSPLFFMCSADGQYENTDVIDSVPGLRTDDKMILMAAPLFTREDSGFHTARAFATCMAAHTNGRLLDIPELRLDVLERPVSGDRTYLKDLESLHKNVILYAWLSYRVGGIFTDRTLAAHVKEMVEERMIRALTEFSANKKLRKDSSLRRQIGLQKQIEEQNRIMADANISSAEALAAGAENAPDGTPETAETEGTSAPDDDALDHSSEKVSEDVTEQADDVVAEDIPEGDAEGVSHDASVDPGEGDTPPQPRSTR